MNLQKAQARDHINAINRASIHGGLRRTLEAIFRHPAANNLEWMDVVELIGEIGSIERRHSGEYDVHVGGKHHLMHKPHTKDITAPEVAALRHFLQGAGWSPEAPSQADPHPDPASPTLMVVLAPHGVRIYRVEPAAGDALKLELRPYDPEGLLHDLAQKDPAMVNGPEVSDDTAFLERIANAASAGGKIIVVTHDMGKSERDGRLADYLRTHHPKTYQRVVSELTADLSSITPAQLLVLAAQELTPAT